MSAWDRCFSSDNDSYCLCRGSHQAAYCSDFDGSVWTGPSQYDADTILSVEQTVTWCMVCGQSGHTVAMNVVNLN